MLSLCLIPDNISLNHFVKVVSAGFLHREVTVSPFDINQDLEREIFQSTDMFYFFLKFSFSHFSIHRWIWHATVITTVFDKW